MAALSVLVVDDAAFIRDLVKKSVRDTYPGCDISEAADGRRAISLMNSKAINLVLCDWEMPELSGLDVLQWMRADERYKTTPFMMISSRGERDHVVKAVDAGVSDYIGKPFTREHFVGKLTRLVWKQLKIKPARTGAQQPAASETASLLLAGQTPPSAAKPVNVADTGSVLAAGQMNKPVVRKSAESRAVANIRFGSGALATLQVKDISLQELIGVFRREGPPPALLEPVVLDIADPGSAEVARINGYVRMLQAQEAHPDAQTIQVIIRYVDDDPEKLATLSRFIARVR